LVFQSESGWSFNRTLVGDLSTGIGSWFSKDWFVFSKVLDVKTDFKEKKKKLIDTGFSFGFSKDGFG